MVTLIVAGIGNINVCNLDGCAILEQVRAIGERNIGSCAGQRNDRRIVLRTNKDVEALSGVSTCSGGCIVLAVVTTVIDGDFQRIFAVEILICLVLQCGEEGIDFRQGFALERD